MSVYVVIGASGGLGTSTFAVLLARYLGTPSTVSSIVDLRCDRSGLWPILGEYPTCTWENFTELRGLLRPEQMLDTLPRWRDVRYLSGIGKTNPPIPAVAAVLASLAQTGPVVVEATVDTAQKYGLDEVDAQLVVVSGLSRVQVNDCAHVLGRLHEIPGFEQTQVIARRIARHGMSPTALESVVQTRVIGVIPNNRMLTAQTNHGVGPRLSAWSAYGRVIERTGKRLHDRGTAVSTVSTALWSVDRV